MTFVPVFRLIHGSALRSRGEAVGPLHERQATVWAMPQCAWRHTDTLLCSEPCRCSRDALCKDRMAARGSNQRLGWTRNLPLKYVKEATSSAADDMPDVSLVYPQRVRPRRSLMPPTTG